MDEHYMEMALQLARLAEGRTSPNPMVGAVVVKNGQVVGQGYHPFAGGPHGEVVALAEAGEEARGATIYVTLEPCCHQGRTGPCTEAILAAGIARAVVAMEDPNPLVRGGGIRRLLEGGVEVTTGVFEEKARVLNEVFIKYITTGIPFVAAKAATSLDGKIATTAGQSQWITGAESRAYGHKLRNRYDAILVGRGTVQADDPALTTRLPEGDGKDPVRIILDSGANISPQAKVLTGDSKAATLIATTGIADRERVRTLEENGAKILVVNEKPPVDLPVLVSMLGKMNITSLLIEGGATVHGTAFKAKLVDRAFWFIAPRFIGGQKAPGPIGNPGFSQLAATPVLVQKTITPLGEDYLIEGQVLYER